MIELTNPVTGHTVRTDGESVEFWSAAGYREQSKPTKRAAPKPSKKS